MRCGAGLDGGLHLDAGAGGEHRDRPGEHIVHENLRDHAEGGIAVDAARLDGAGPVALFRHIQLPHLLRPMAVVAMTEEMMKGLEEERRARRIATIPEVVRIIVSEFFKKKSEN